MMMKERTISPTRRRRLIQVSNFILVVLIIWGIIWGIRTFFRLDDTLYTDDARVDVYITPINTRVAGYIKAVRYSDHQALKTGDTLLLLDDREYRVQLEQAEATWQAAIAQRNTSRLAVNIARSGIPVMEAQQQSLDARIWIAHQNYRRFESLLRDSAATGLQFEQAKAEYESLMAEARGRSGQRKTISLAAAEASSRIAINNAEVQQAAARREQALLNLSYTIIRAPYDGVAGIRTVQEGQLLQAGQTVMAIVKSDRKWVIANFRETQVTRLHVGQRMEVRIDGFPGAIFPGRIMTISPATGNRFSAVPTENATGNFVKVRQRVSVRIELQPPVQRELYDRLIGGMNAEVTIVGE